MTSQHKRRRYLVDAALQYRMLIAGLVHGGLVLLALICGVLAPVVSDLSSSPTRRFEEEALIMLYLHERLPWIVLSCVVVVSLTSIRQSHRIAGPMVRFKRHLRCLAAGELPPPLRTRRADMLKDEVACLNAAIDGIAARVDAVRNAQLAAHGALRRLEAADVDVDGRHREALRAAMARVDAALGAFTSAAAEPFVAEDAPPSPVATSPS
jgi:hypothetical protein